MTEKSERAGGILGDFSVSQLLATALAAATSFALSTQIGVAGSIIGAVVGAVASAEHRDSCHESAFLLVMGIEPRLFNMG